MRGKSSPGQTIQLEQDTEYRVFPNKSRVDWNAGPVVIRRGYNGVIGWSDQPGAGIVDATAPFKATENFGFNVLRLPISWSALEPAKGSYDESYVDRVAGVVTTAESAGLVVLVDFQPERGARPRWTALPA